MTESERENIREELLAAADEGSVSCKKAFELASRFDVKPSVIGDIADREGIKIVKCQLGCF